MLVPPLSTAGLEALQVPNSSARVLVELWIVGKQWDAGVGLSICLLRLAAPIRAVVSILRKTAGRCLACWLRRWQQVPGHGTGK